jgi:hypothetical protein
MQWRMEKHISLCEVFKCFIYYNEASITLEKLGIHICFKLAVYLCTYNS